MHLHIISQWLVNVWGRSHIYGYYSDRWLATYPSQPPSQISHWLPSDKVTQKISLFNGTWGINRDRAALGASNWKEMKGSFGIEMMHKWWLETPLHFILFSEFIQLVCHPFVSLYGFPVWCSSGKRPFRNAAQSSFCGFSLSAEFAISHWKPLLLSRISSPSCFFLKVGSFSD